MKVVIHHRTAHVVVALAFLLPLCSHAATAAKVPQHASEATTSRHSYLGTYLFEWLSGGKFASNSPLNREWKKLLTAQRSIEMRFEKRLTSGPATPAEAIEIENTTYFGFTTCQAHACDNAKVAVLFRPADNRTVGMLWDKCRLMPLGSPTDAESVTLIRLGKFPEQTPVNKARCEQEL